MTADRERKWNEMWAGLQIEGLLFLFAKYTFPEQRKIGAIPLSTSLSRSVAQPFSPVSPTSFGLERDSLFASPVSPFTAELFAHFRFSIMDCADIFVRTDFLNKRAISGPFIVFYGYPQVAITSQGRLRSIAEDIPPFLPYPPPVVCGLGN